MKALALHIILVCFAINGLGQGLKAKGKIIVDNKGNEIILRGVGLGGWMLQEPYMLQLSGVAIAQHDIRKKISELIGEENTQQFYEAWLNNHCTKADIDSLAAWGFNSVRLPMHFNLFTLPVSEEPVKGKDTWLEKGFTLTDSLLAWCKANKIYLILDLHAAPGGQGNDNAISDRDTSYPSLWQSEPNQQKTIALWEKLAERYAKEEWIGAYDIINEPNWGFENMADRNGCAEKSNKPLTELFKKITAAIRKTDKKHMIIIEGNCWGNNYENMFPLWDDNMVLSFHKYWNYTDKNSIKKFLDYREKYKIPIWMGESGENSNSWFTDAIQLLEQNKIGWAWWPLKKIGINNPMQIKPNPGYQRILDYWKKKGSKPSPGEATKAFMQLAIDTKTSNNIIQRDVVDAMQRQVRSLVMLPFGKNIVAQNTVIFVTDYDLGKLNHAYYDKDSGNYWVSNNHRTDWNKGWQYRNDGVDIEACTDSLTNGYQVGWTEDGEWLHFSLLAEQEGTYSTTIRYASKEKNGQVQFIVNDDVSGEIELPVTGSFNTWQKTNAYNLKLRKGKNNIRLLMKKGGFNLNYFQLIYQNSTANIN